MSVNPEKSYKRSIVVVFILRIILITEKVLPQKVFGNFYNFSFSIYRKMIRIYYLRRYLLFFLIRDANKIGRTKNVFKTMPYSLVGWRGLEATHDTVYDVGVQNLIGDLVECGVAQGGCAALMALANEYSKGNRHIWLFDSFEGLPEPTAKDYVDNKTGNHFRPLPKGACLGTLDQVSELLFEHFQFDSNNISLIKGWFQDTLPIAGKDIQNIAVLRLDGDWYDSTLCCLKNLFPKVVKGGYIIIDDYFSCFGSRKAVDEYLSLENRIYELIPDGRGGVYFKKI